MVTSFIFLMRLKKMSGGIKGVGKWGNGGIISIVDIKLLEHQPGTCNFQQRLLT